MKVRSARSELGVAPGGPRLVKTVETLYGRIGFDDPPVIETNIEQLGYHIQRVEVRFNKR